MMVLTFGMSMPFSMIVVETKTSSSALDEFGHDRLELHLVHLTMSDANACLGDELLECARDRIDRFDAVMHVVDLSAAIEVLP